MPSSQLPSPSHRPGQVPPAPPGARTGRTGRRVGQVPPAPWTNWPAPSASLPARRLHPAVIGVWALAGIGPLLLLAIIGTLNLLIAGFIVVFAVAGSAVRWWRFTWHRTSTALVIDQGILQRQRRIIPLERIQSVEEVRQLRHRLFGVTGLRVEAVGGSETQGQLDALTHEEASDLREELLSGRSAGPTPTDPPPPAARPTPRPADGAAATPRSEAGDRAAADGHTDGPGTASASAVGTGPSSEPDTLAVVTPGRLVLAGLTGGRVGVVAALLGFASQAFAEQTAAIAETATGWVGATGIAGVAVAVALFALAVFTLSVAATVVTFWDFTLTRDARYLTTRRGLLDQRRGVIPVHRVQTVRVDENLVRRALGLAAVRVEVAGQAGEAADTTSVALPIGRRADAFALAAAILRRPALAEVALSPMPPGARARRIVRAVAFAAVLGTAATVWVGPPGAAAFALVLPAVLLARSAYAALGHARAGDVVVARLGVFTRRTTFTPQGSLHALARSASPWQRRRGLATVTLHIARSPSAGGADPALLDLADHDADRYLADLAVHADLGGRLRRDAAGRVVRAATDADDDAVVALYRPTLGAHAEAVRGLAGGDDEAATTTRGLVCERDGVLLGHALLSPAIDSAGEPADRATDWVLAPVAVTDGAEARDVGARLLQRALAAAAARGAHRVVTFGVQAAGLAPTDPPRGAPPGAQGSWRLAHLPAAEGDGEDGATAGAVQLDPRIARVVGEGFEPS